MRKNRPMHAPSFWVEAILAAIRQSLQRGWPGEVPWVLVAAALPADMQEAFRVRYPKGLTIIVHAFYDPGGRGASAVFRTPTDGREEALLQFVVQDTIARGVVEHEALHIYQWLRTLLADEVAAAKPTTWRYGIPARKARKTHDRYAYDADIEVQPYIVSIAREGAARYVDLRFDQEAFAREVTNWAIQRLRKSHPALIDTPGRLRYVAGGIYQEAYGTYQEMNDAIRARRKKSRGKR